MVVSIREVECGQKLGLAYLLITSCRAFEQLFVEQNSCLSNFKTDHRRTMAVNLDAGETCSRHHPCNSAVPSSGND